MNLSTSAKNKLNDWATPSTWNTSHDLDMNRFYEFLDQYVLDHGKIINETDLTNEIANITGTPTHPDSANLDTIRERVSLAVNILEFLKTSGR